jgi:hypothetical protein
MKSERNRMAEGALLGHEAHLSKTDQAAKAAEMKQRTSAAGVAKSGRDSRIKGHVEEAGRRNQGKRDAKQDLT